MRYGWLKVPGVQDGDRSIDEQVHALFWAIEECKGKSILDLGCAEGLIGREFIRAGAAEYMGVDAVEGHIEVARQQCAGLPMEFQLIDLNNVVEGWAHTADIVLCLGIAHKLRNPGKCIEIAARSARELVLIRSGRGADSKGIITSKRHRDSKCDSHAIMRAHGFDLTSTAHGPEPHKESVEYWYRGK